MTIIYHNPRCSKSRETLALLESNQIEAQIRLYLDDTPSVDELKTLLAQLDMSPIQLMRTKEALYKENNLHLDTVTDEERLAAMTQFPKLIERPIVIHNEKAKIGRPPEQVLALFK
ncbi:arsenate reductase family protein [Marinomonas sp. MED121]|uniref:arsenate reductase (glutaredoxin) n=1 Tax=Marinomonas sp. MED121 TaxID=314277 RepID=UPI000069085E|nr:arsenate reductase (glutaredoxin) [Marinomonas sp. MED121]EAQ64501.1 arsenate reductase family protein [Marinomonas sp. MED121]